MRKTQGCGWLANRGDVLEKHLQARLRVPFQNISGIRATNQPWVFRGNKLVPLHPCSSVKSVVSILSLPLHHPTGQPSAVLIRAFPRLLTLRAAFGSLIRKVPTLFLLRSCLSAVFLGAPQRLDSRATAQSPGSSHPPRYSVVVKNISE